MKKTLLAIALLAIATPAHAADPTWAKLTITGTAALPASTTVSGTSIGSLYAPASRLLGTGTLTVPTTGTAALLSDIPAPLTLSTITGTLAANKGGTGASALGATLSVTSGTLGVVTGTAANTVAAGDDSRIVNAVQVGGTTTNLTVTGTLNAATLRTSEGSVMLGDGASSEAGGGAVGSNSHVNNGGGAVGNNAHANNGGGAVGSNASTDFGGAVGDGASAVYGGGAVGGGASASYQGFAGGYDAKANGVESVQLGTGTNATDNTLQFRSYPLLDANGKIPDARFSGTTANLFVTGSTTLGDASGDTLTIHAGTVSTPNAYFRRTKAALDVFAAKQGTYNNQSLTVTAYGTAQVVSYVDGASGSFIEIPLPVSEFAGKTVKIGVMLAVSGTSGGDVNMRLMVGTATAAQFSGTGGTGYLLSSGGINTWASGSDGNSGAAYSAPATAGNPVIRWSNAMTIPSDAAAIFASIGSMRNQANDTNTDTLYLHTIRVVEQ